jgi:rubrerythrin
MTKISEKFELKNHITSSDGQVLMNVQSKGTTARYLLICESCLWCASNFKSRTTPTKCPLCYNGEIDSIPIADDKNGFSDYSYSKGIE